MLKLGLESDERNKPLPKKRTSVPPSRYTDSDETDVENTPVRLFVFNSLNEF